MKSKSHKKLKKKDQKKINKALLSYSKKHRKHSNRKTRNKAFSKLNKLMNKKTKRNHKKSKTSKKSNSKRRKIQKGGHIPKRILLPLAVTVAAFSIAKAKLKKQINKLSKRLSTDSINNTTNTTERDNMELQRESFESRGHSNINILDWTNIKIGHVLGDGTFGQVAIGEYYDTQCTIPKSFIAIKKLKTIMGEDDANFDSIINECILLDKASTRYEDGKPIYNKNCVRLIGMLFGDIDRPSKAVSLVSEHCQYGSLLDFIDKDCYGYITAKGFANWSYQIAHGMQFIAENGIIHRDLAARNILVDALYNAKISDFGLSFMIEENDNDDTITSNSFQIPIRWSSPHVISRIQSITSVKPQNSDGSERLSSIWNKTTDIWAYGIVVFEILTKGQLPYSQHNTNQKVIDHLTSELSHEDKGPKLPDGLVSESSFLIENDNGGSLMRKIWSIIQSRCFTDSNDNTFDNIVQELSSLMDSKQPSSREALVHANKYNQKPVHKDKQYYIYKNHNNIAKHEDSGVYHVYEYDNVKGYTVSTKKETDDKFIVRTVRDSKGQIRKITSL